MCRPSGAPGMKLLPLPLRLSPEKMAGWPPVALINSPMPVLSAPASPWSMRKYRRRSGSAGSAPKSLMQPTSCAVRPRRHSVTSSTRPSSQKLNEAKGRLPMWKVCHALRLVPEAAVAEIKAPLWYMRSSVPVYTSARCCQVSICRMPGASRVKAVLVLLRKRPSRVEP